MVAAISAGAWPCKASSTYWKPPVLPRPMIGGRLSGMAIAPCRGRELAAQAGNDGVGALARLGALLIGFELRDEERLVRRGDGIDEVVADDGEQALDAAAPAA